MKLLNVKLKNFKCFEDFDIPFDERYNLHVLIAPNMAGKSALLKAMRIGISHYLNVIAPEEQMHIAGSDHKVWGRNPLADLALDCSVTCQAQVTTQNQEKISVEWTRYKDHPDKWHTKSIYSGNKEEDIRKISKDLYHKVAHKKEGVLPLLMYLGTEYLHTDKAKTDRFSHDGSLIQGYWSAFEDKNISHYVFNWLTSLDSILRDSYNSEQLSFAYSSMYEGMPEQQLALTRKIVSILLPDVENILWLIGPPKKRTKGDTIASGTKVTTLVFKNGEVRTYNMLSDGYKYLVLLAGELAVRSFLINKHAGVTVNEKINGVVLIDEFGIHLHPDLQNQALQRLQEAFPHVQFIVTTHSPMMLNGLKKEQVHILEADKNGNRTVRHPERDIIGLGAEGILTEVFGLKTTYDRETVDHKQEYLRLFRLKMGGSLTQQDEEKMRALAEILGARSYDPGMEDMNYRKFLKKFQERYQNNASYEVDNVSDEEFYSMVSDVFEEYGQENSNIVTEQISGKDTKEYDEASASDVDEPDYRAT